MSAKLSSFAVSALLLTAAVASAAEITTSKRRYDVGEPMTITGTGFTPNAVVNVTVQRPDRQIDTVPNVNANASGAFSAIYNPPYIPGRYRITATDGTNAATTATTEADAIGYNKAVYNKSTTATVNPPGVWTSGNAGNNYLENQWAYYQYQVTGIGSAATVPDFDVAFNHYQPNSKAIFVDALANFRACIDCTTSTNASGPMEGMLSDGVAYPPTSVTNWVNAAPAISKINKPFVNGACQVNDDPQDTPSEEHCFHVSGAALAALFPPATFTSGVHTITLFYEAHLAASFVWTQGNQSLLGCSTSVNYATPGPEVIPAGVIYGADAYSGNPLDVCTKNASDTGNGTTDGGDWVSAGVFGVGFATGSSRHFYIQNQTDGAQGNLTLPIPTVAAPQGQITIVKVTNPAVATGFVFNFTGTLGAFVLDTDPSATNPNSRTFTGLTGGVPYQITESNLPTGWTLSNLNCVSNSGTNNIVTSLGTGTATVTLDTATGASVTCTYTNTGTGSITINKNTVGGDGTFAYTTTGGSPLAGFNITTTAGSGSNNFTNVPPGNYSVTESGPAAGWQFTSLVCTNSGTGTSFTVSSQTANIVLAPGGNVTCTYVNTKQGTIVINKTTVGGDGTFQYTTTGGAPLANFSLTTPGATATTTFNNVVPGTTYTVTESGPPTGWQFTSLSCSQGGSNSGQVATIVVEPGQTVTCTYTNTKQGTITIVKNTLGGDDTFGFTAGGAPLANFNLTTVSGTQQQQYLNVPPGNFTVTENAAPAGWQFTSLSCAGNGAGGNTSGQTANIVLAAGGNVTCTYTNTKLGRIIITKTTVGGDGTFQYATTGGAPLSNFSLTTPGATATTTFNNVIPGTTYTVTESGPPAGWQFTSLSCSQGGSNSGQVATIVVDPGQTVTCTYTNTKQGTITIVKNTVGGNDTFGFTAGGAPLANFNLTTVNGTQQQQYLNVPPGNFTVTENAAPTGWQFTSLSCSGNGAGGNTSGQTANIVLAAGGNVICTYTNTKQGTIRIVKNALGGNDTFGYTAGGAPLANFNLLTVNGTNQQEYLNVPPGNFTVTENAAPAGWQFTSLSCTGNGPGGNTSGQTANIVLQAGGTVVCTYTNTKLGTIRIVKNTVGGNDTFGFTAGGAPLANFNLLTVNGTNQQEYQNVPPGNFTVTENAAPAGWQFTSLSCTGNGPGGNTSGQTANIVLPAGGTVVCTYTNSKLGQIIINKQTVGGDGTFQYTTNGGSPLANFGLTTASNFATTTFNNVIPGTTYTVAESGPPADWQFTSLSCDAGGSSSGQVATIVVPAGGTVTCTFTNTKKGRIIITKQTIGGDGTFQYTTTGGSPLANFSLTTPGATASTTINNVIPGTTYTVTESGPPAGWQFTSLSCSAGGSNSGQTATIVVQPGQTVTCTYTNTKQGTIVIRKVTVGGNGTFNFTGTGGAPVGNFNLAGGGTQTINNVPPGGPYTITESGLPTGWDLTSLSCTTGGSGNGAVATINIAAGQTVTCTYTNSLRPSLTIIKHSTGGATFGFTVNGPTASNPSITTSGTPATGQSGPGFILPGGYVVSESSLPAGWTMTDISCSIGTAGADTNSDGIPNSWGFTANYGDNIVCTFINSNVGTTRTQGFWQTHTVLANSVWNGSAGAPVGSVPVIGSADAKLCTINDITAIEAPDSNQLMGAFWSSISQRTTNPRRRNDLDQARMQMLQQYMAAVLNVHAFGSGSPAMLATARTAYCGTDIDAIRNQMSLLAAFNEGGDSLPFTPGASATAQLSRTQAAIPFWDKTDN